jgi:hypothetical protein
MHGSDVGYRADSLPLEEGDAGTDVALVSGTCERREPPLDPAVLEEVRKLSVHGRPFSRPKTAAPKLMAILRLQAC